MTHSRDHVILQPAYVLHSTPYRDTSVLLEVFTPDHGRIGLVARGVRTAKSRLRGVLQPFRPLLISWHSKGDLGTLTTAEVNVEEGGAATCLVGHALMSGFYLNELLMRLLHRHDPHPASFHSYDIALRKLVLAAVPAHPCAHRTWASAVHGYASAARGRMPKAAGPADNDVMLQQALRIFEKELLRDIGYGLVLDRDVMTGEPVTAEGMYRYHLEKGPERMECATATPLANTLGIVLHGRTLLGLAHNELDRGDVLQEAKKLLRKLLAVRLGRQPLRSRELYNEMRAIISM